MLIETSDVSLEEQAQILHAKREWEETFDAVSDMVFIVDNNHTILRVNHAMSERFGLSPQELVGKKCFEVLHGTSFAPAECPHARMLALGLAQTSLPTDEYVNGVFDVVTSPLYNSEGQITASVHVARDVTEKRRQEELLEEHRRQLEELNNSLETRITEAVAELRKKDDILIQQSRLIAMGEMISNIAHQWRQPLNNIGLIVQNIQLAYKAHDLTEEELDANISEAMKALQQISETIDDFRDFYSFEPAASTFFVNDVICRCLGIIEPSLKRKGIKVKFEEEPDLLTDGYPNEYLQAILNILLNARDALVEHMGDNPLINVRLFRENGFAVVTVRDNGGGIAEDIMPKIFDPYFTTKQKNIGVGIGLYMAKMIIEKKMGGTLTVSNVEGGAEFRVESLRAVL